MTFDAVAENGFLEHRFPRFAVSGIGADDVDGLAEHGFDDAIDVLLVGGLADDIDIHGRRGLVARHGGGGIVGIT